MATKRRRKARKSRWCVFTGAKGQRKHSCHRRKSDANRVAKNLRAKRGTGVRVRKLAA